MFDAFSQSQELAHQRSRILEQNHLHSGQYALVTIHRAANTDNPMRLTEIVKALNSVQEQVIFPMHPRTKKALQSIHAVFHSHVRVIAPVGYLDMLMLEENARIIGTDSGGVQREAYFLTKPCLTFRDETEWMETVTSGWNILVGAEKEKILAAWFNFQLPVEKPPIFGDGTAAKQIGQILRD
jgi:UDP-N-acetylglucosamine 2-epimerase